MTPEDIANNTTKQEKAEPPDDDIVALVGYFPNVRRMPNVIRINAGMGNERLMRAQGLL